MLDLIRSPFKSAFEEFAKNVSSDCLICSPYITLGPIKMFTQSIVERQLAKEVQVNVLTDISLRTLVQGATDISALLYLFENLQNVSIAYLPKIHAKVYVANKSSAIITSANFTDGGEKKNFEYGVRIDDLATVIKIQNDITEYGKLGATVNPSQLQEIQLQVNRVKQSIQSEQKSISRTIRLESRKQERIAEDNLIRVRVKDRAINSIFAETILYLLSQRPMSTQEMHLYIKDIHPDLCDNNFDRIIDGRHYGKLWKHQVRNTQAYLKRTRQVFYDEENRLWHK